MPKDLSVSQIAALHQLSSDAPEAEADIAVGVDGIFHRTLTIRTNDVILVKPKKVQPVR
jgi:xylan 1,4-beta-xylosidase